MKKIMIALILAAAGGCAKQGVHSPVAASSGVVAPALSGARRLFQDTARQNLPALQAAAASLANAGAALDTTLTERCLEEEKGRPEVERLCLFLWAMGGERSDPLERKIASLALSERIMAVAAIRHQFALRQISPGHFSLLLAQLAADPVWLRAKATRIWARHGGIADRSARAEAVKLVEGAGPETPADFRELYYALHALSPAEGATLASEECQPEATGELRMRCWRFLSVFVDPATGFGLPAELQGRGGERGDGWALFKLHSPLRARLIERQFNQ